MRRIVQHTAHLEVAYGVYIRSVQPIMHRRMSAPRHTCIDTDVSDCADHGLSG